MFPTSHITLWSLSSRRSQVNLIIFPHYQCSVTMSVRITSSLCHGHISSLSGRRTENEERSIIPRFSNVNPAPSFSDCTTVNPQPGYLLTLQVLTAGPHCPMICVLRAARYRLLLLLVLSLYGQTSLHLTAFTQIFSLKT